MALLVRCPTSYCRRKQRCDGSIKWCIGCGCSFEVYGEIAEISFGTPTAGPGDEIRIPISLWPVWYVAPLEAA